MDLQDKDTIFWAKMRAEALIPTKEKENAGYDLYAAFDEPYIIINPYQTKLIPTGIAWACSDDFYMQVEERSSTGRLGIKRSGGIIDSGFRGEIKVAIFNANNKPLIFSPYSERDVKEMINLTDFIYYSTSKAIAQGIIHRVEKLKSQEIDYESLLEIPSIRGENGWGSTNKG